MSALNKQIDIYKVSEESRLNSINLNAAFMASLFPKEADESNNAGAENLDLNQLSTTHNMNHKFPFLFVQYDRQRLLLEMQKVILKRQNEISTVLSYLDKNVPRMTALHVIGPPGCGKTLLCTKALELYQPMPNVIVDCKGYGSMKQFLTILWDRIRECIIKQILDSFEDTECAKAYINNNTSSTNNANNSNANYKKPHSLKRKRNEEYILSYKTETNSHSKALLNSEMYQEFQCIVSICANFRKCQPKTVLEFFHVLQELCLFYQQIIQMSLHQQESANTTEETIYNHESVSTSNALVHPGDAYNFILYLKNFHYCNYYQDNSCELLLQLHIKCHASIKLIVSSINANIKSSTINGYIPNTVNLRMIPYNEEEIQCILISTVTKEDLLYNLLVGSKSCTSKMVDHTVTTDGLVYNKYQTIYKNIVINILKYVHSMYVPSMLLITRHMGELMMSFKEMLRTIVHIWKQNESEIHGLSHSSNDNRGVYTVSIDNSALAIQDTSDILLFLQTMHNGIEEECIKYRALNTDYKAIENHLRRIISLHGDSIHRIIKYPVAQSLSIFNNLVTLGDTLHRNRLFSTKWIESMTTSQKYLLVAAYVCPKKRHNTGHELVKKRSLAKINHLERTGDGVFDDGREMSSSDLTFNARNMNQKQMEYFDLEALLKLYKNMIYTGLVLTGRNKTRVRINMGSDPNKHVSINPNPIASSSHNMNDYKCDVAMMQMIKSLSGNADLLRMVTSFIEHYKFLAVVYVGGSIKNHDLNHISLASNLPMSNSELKSSNISTGHTLLRCTVDYWFARQVARSLAISLDEYI